MDVWKIYDAQNKLLDSSLVALNLSSPSVLFRYTNENETE